MNDKTYMTLMRVLPKAALSRAVGTLTRVPVPAALHQTAMRLFASRFKVDLDQADGGIEDFKTFGSFFTRKLKPGSRPIDQTPNTVVSPVDGAVSQAGVVENGACIQAKGIDFPLGQLLGDEERAKAFEGGAFTTLYLSPRDYHRIHTPLEGTIDGFVYLPGQFWPVNPPSVANVKGLFAINERLVTWMTTPLGQVAVVAVGATCVARIHATYDNIVTNTGTPAQAKRYDKPIPVERGAELGMFEMGSTVILVFEPGKVKWDASLTSGAVVQVGQKLGGKP
ncbi:MAG: archaetidylserine decarboxylase [Myxococcaceae bacterium]